MRLFLKKTQHRDAMKTYMEFFQFETVITIAEADIKLVDK